MFWWWVGARWWVCARAVVVRLIPPRYPLPLPPCRGYCPRGYFRVRVRAGRGLMGPVWLRVVVSVVLTASVASVWLTEPQGVHCVDTLQGVSVWATPFMLSVT